MYQIILLIKSLIKSSLFPQSPLFTNDYLLHLNPPLGLLNLNDLIINIIKYHKNLLASLKCSPTVYIS